MSDFFNLFGFSETNRLGLKKGQRFVEVNPLTKDRPDYLEYNGMLDGKLEFSILTHDFKNFGGARLSEDEFEDSLKHGIWKTL